MLKHKSHEDRKRLLHELEMRQQKEMNLKYKMEHEKLVHDGEIAMMHLEAVMSAEERLHYEQEIEDRWLAEQAQNTSPPASN